MTVKLSPLGVVCAVSVCCEAEFSYKVSSSTCAVASELNQEKHFLKSCFY